LSKRDTVDGLGTKLALARGNAGLSQAQASEATGAPQPMISLYERGERTPTLAMIYKLAKAYGVKACDLLPLDSEVVLDAESEPPAKKPKGKK
jgi:transcriptional regulator with XRE-family HTH domain